MGYFMCPIYCINLENGGKTMEKPIKVKITENYGQRRIVPVDKPGKVLAKIAGTKTLTPETIELAKMLGFHFGRHKR